MSDSQISAPEVLPASAFNFLPSVYALASVWAQRHGIRGGDEYYTLAYLRRCERALDKYPGCPYGEITDALLRTMQYSASEPNKTIQKLHRREYIQNFRLTAREYKRVYGHVQRTDGPSAHFVRLR